MSDCAFPVIRITIAEFNEWVRTGIHWLHMPGPVVGDDDVWVQLLPKFDGWPEYGRAPAALIDEVVAITLKTPELTADLAARLRNLGEAWLPFDYFVTDQAAAPTAIPVGIPDAPPTDAEVQAPAKKKRARQDKEPAGASPGSPPQSQGPESQGPESQGRTSPKAKPSKSTTAEQDKSKSGKRQPGKRKQNEQAQPALFEGQEAGNEPPESKG